MKDSKADAKFGNDVQTTPQDVPEAISEQKLSRLERLKQKILKLKGDDPDIYPMW